MILGSITGAVLERSVDVVEALGLLGMAALLLLEALVPPIPSEAVLLLGGFLVGDGRYGFLEVLAATTTGSVVGALILYVAGRWLGHDRLLAVLARVGRPIRVTPADLERANAWFERHGPAVIAFGRLVPLVRSLISIPAGADRMPVGRFVAYTAVGSAGWNAVVLGVGWTLGDRWEQAQPWTDAATGATVVALLAAAGTSWWRRRDVAVPPAAAAAPIDAEV